MEIFSQIECKDSDIIFLKKGIAVVFLRNKFLIIYGLWVRGFCCWWGKKCRDSL